MPAYPDCGRGGTPAGSSIIHTPSHPPEVQGIQTGQPANSSGEQSPVSDRRSPWSGGSFLGGQRASFYTVTSGKVTASFSLLCLSASLQVVRCVTEVWAMGAWAGWAVPLVQGCLLHPSSHYRKQDGGGGGLPTPNTQAGMRGGHSDLQLGEQPEQCPYLCP